ncbi:hypothetical protein Pcinc_009637 [Petrolisthes cinctipes]|uniref:Uncharacterized protein n=1 Tax=Petrolisthes cinctipes TaxID=88211 RepID=A0AAE1KW86_PETCI|nr:hypothetical protein Pcinc_009637 [Petrolisthes cinctipes]
MRAAREFFLLLLFFLVLQFELASGTEKSPLSPPPPSSSKRRLYARKSDNNNNNSNDNNNNNGLEAEEVIITLITQHLKDQNIVLVIPSDGVNVGVDLNRVLKRVKWSPAKTPPIPPPKTSPIFASTYVLSSLPIPASLHREPLRASPY